MIDLTMVDKQLRFSEIQAEFTNLPILPNFLTNWPKLPNLVKIKNLLKVLKLTF